MAFGENNVMSKDKMKLMEEQREARRKQLLFGGAQSVSTMNTSTATASDDDVSDVVMISLDLIDPNPDNDSLNGTDDIDSLADAMKEDGFLGVLIVIKKDDKRYEISWGHRRYLSLKANGETTARCIVLENKNDVERAKLLLRGNMNERNVTPLIMAKRLQYYIDHVFKPLKMKGRARDGAAAFFGISTANAHRYLCLLKMSDSLQSLANDMEFPFTAIASAVNLSPSEQEDLYIWIMDHYRVHDDTYPTKQLIEQKIEIIQNHIPEKASVSTVNINEYVDKSIFKIEKSLSEYQNGNISVKDKEKVASSIVLIESYIAEIRKKIGIVD